MVDFKYYLTNKELLDIHYDLCTFFSAIARCQSKLNESYTDKDDKWVDAVDTINYLEQAKDLIESLLPYLDEEYASDYVGITDKELNSVLKELGK